MLAYELLAYLKYLTLAPNEKGELEWVGSRDKWNEAQKEIDYYETFND